MNGEPDTEQTAVSSGRRLSQARRKHLIDALKDLEVLADPARRRKVLQELGQSHGSDFPQSAELLTVPDIVDQCLELDAVHELMEALDTRIETGPVGEADRRLLESIQLRVDEWLPSTILSRAQRGELNAVVAEIPKSDIVLALRDPWLAGHVRFPADEVVDGVEACRRLEGLAVPDSGPPPLLIIMELLAHTRSGQAERKLHQLVGQLSDQLDRKDAVEGLCAQLDEGHSTDDPAPDPAAWDGITNRDRAAAPHSSGDDVKSYTKPTGVGAPADQPLVWGGLPPRNDKFVGRDDLVQTIRDALSGREHGPTVLQNALYGLGGVGKTQLAAEYAYRHRSDYRLVWWIKAEDELSVLRSFASLARRLNLAERTDARENVEAAREALRRDRQYSRWLLVFDNAESPDTVREYLPDGTGDVLITSRTNEWRSEVASAVEVDVFSEKDSVRLLTDRWHGISPQDALELAKRLGHLPLALVQAAAFHAHTAVPLPEYLALLDLNAGDLMDAGNVPGYPRTVAATFRVAFDQLAERSPGAGELLTVLAFLGPNEVDVSLLSRGKSADVPAPLSEVLGDELKLRRAVGDLGRFALAQIDANRNFISVHRLVAEVRRSGLSSEDRERYRKAAHSLLAAANPGRPDQARNWADLKQINPHVLSSKIIESVDIRARQVVIDQIWYLYATGQYDAALTLGLETVEKWRGAFGEDDRMTLIASRELANALRARGRYEEARTLDRDTLDRMRRTLGEDDVHTLAAAMSNAADLRLQGAFAQALELDEATWQRQRALLGPQDPATLSSANNVAVNYRLLGNFARARELDEETVRLRTQVYRADHRRTMFSYRMLARDLYGLGMFHEALELQRSTMADYEKNLTIENHVDLLFARRNMALLLRKVGDYTLAYEYATMLHDTHRRRFGPSHEHTLAAMITLCNTLRVMAADPSLASTRDASLERARDLGSEAHATYQEVLGADHPFTHAAATDLAIVLRAQGRVEEATTLDERAYVSLESQLGPDHPYTMCSAANMSNNFALTERYDEALTQSGDVLERSRQARAEDHPLTLACGLNHALDLYKAGRTEEADALYDDTHLRMLRKLGTNHPDTIRMERRLRAECDIEPPEM